MILSSNMMFWAFVIGFLSALIVKLKGVSLTATISLFLTVTATVILWNWMIEFTKATVYLNVDHPIFRISWADFFDGVSVFSTTALLLGGGVLKNEKASLIIRFASIAAVITIFIDIYFF